MIPGSHATQPATWSIDDERVAIRFLGRSEEVPIETLATRHAPEGASVVRLRQVHGANVVIARLGRVEAGDALVTAHTGLVLAVVTADCVPVVLAGANGVAAVHAGWRGIEAGVVRAAAEALGGADSDLHGWIGPAIGPCCYEVGRDVAAKVVASSHADVARPGPGDRPHLDLGHAVARQLVALGARVHRPAGPCTRCDDRLCSYRRDGAAAGRNVTLVWRRGSSPTQVGAAKASRSSVRRP